MKIDSNKDLMLIEEHIRAKVLEYVNEQASSIIVGFQLDESSWLSVYFDGRKSPVNDGEWTKHIEGNTLKLEQWSSALSQEDTIVVSSNDKIEFEIEDELTSEHMAYVGDLIKSVVCKLIKEGSFEQVVNSSNCQVFIEEISGQYAWVQTVG